MYLKHLLLRSLYLHLDLCQHPQSIWAPLPDYYNANDDWFYFDTQNIMDEMRIATISRPEKFSVAADLSELDYESVAQKFMEII